MKAIRKLLASLMVAVMILTAAPLSGFVGLKLNLDWLDFTPKASAESYSGGCGPDIVWNFNATNGELVLSGTGMMYNYYSGNIPWLEIADEIKTIVFDEDITKIGEWVFFDCDNILNIIIPDSVTSIGSNAFSSCDSLKTITIGDGVTDIGNGAFRECISLEVVTIGDCVVNVGGVAFGACDKIKEVYYKGDLLGWCSISFEDSFSNPLYYAEDLYIDGVYLEGDIVIPNGATSVKNYTFYEYKWITAVVIPSSVRTIGKHSFYGCTNIKELVFSNSVESIGAYAFGGCRNLDYVTIPDSVTSIDKYAFYSCTNLHDIILPFSVQSIGSNAFAGCQNLEKITVYSSNCSFYSDCISYYTTIVGYEGSTAEAYADKNDFDFELIPDNDHEHIYSNSCDAECNICGYINNEASHIYDNGCDPDCNVCGEIRTDLTHTYTNDCDPDCDICGNIRSDLIHTDDNSDGICDVCEKALSDILVGITQNFKVNAGETVYIKFVPANSGVYTYYSSSDRDTYGYVYDADKNQLAYNDDGGNESNFSITYTVKAGTVYYLGVRYYNLNYSGEIPVTIRLDELICDHNNRHDEHKDSTCTEEGYNKVVCDDCGNTISYETLPLAEHTYKTITAEPTCLDEGVVVCLCSVCRYAYISEILDPLGHSELIWVTVKTPTTRKEGVMNLICPACDEVFGTKTVPAITLSGNSTANIDFETNTITGFDSGSTSIDYYLSATNNGYTFTCESEKIGTGTVITLANGEDLINEYEAVIFGDVNGDSWYDGQDAIIVDCLANGMLTREDVGEAVYMAADCNHDGVIDQFDVDLLNQAGTLLANVDQSKPAEVLIETSAAYVEYLGLIDQTPVTIEVDDNIQDDMQSEAPIDIITFILNFIESLIRMFISLI